MKQKTLKTLVLTLLAGTLLAAGCKEEEYDGVTRYQVVGAVPSYAAELIATATVYEYDADDRRVDSNIIANPQSGTEYTYLPTEATTHLKVKLVSKEETFRWGDTIIRIVPHEMVTIKISPLSPVRLDEPTL